MGELSETIAAQARQLWAHLPPDEVGDDEELLFKTDSAGNLLVAVPATGRTYRLAEGVAWRAQVLPTGEVEVTSWQHGELCERRLILVEEESVQWN